MGMLSFLIGFFVHIFPSGIKLFQDYMDKKQELAILNLNLQNQRIIDESDNKEHLAATDVQADVQWSKNSFDSMAQQTGVKFVDGYRAMVRPSIAYGIFALFALHKIASISGFVHTGWHLSDLGMVWDSTDYNILSCVIGFYFGGRAFEKK